MTHARHGQQARRLASAATMIVALVAIMGTAPAPPRDAVGTTQSDLRLRDDTPSVAKVVNLSISAGIPPSATDAWVDLGASG